MSSVRLVSMLSFSVLAWAVTQACAIEVKNFPVGDPSAGGQGGQTNQGGSAGSGANAAADLLAQPCTTKADCGPDLDCFDENLPQAGFPGGYCSSYCTSFADCPPNGWCIDGLCLLRCDHGVEVATKCRGRTDLACAIAGKDTNQAPVCIPTCGVDAECGATRKCDRVHGVCIDSDPTGTGLPVDSCSNLTTPDSCRGCCTLGACLESCGIGSPNACGGDPTYECVPRDPSGTTGDAGICSVQCAGDMDCPGLGISCSYSKGGSTYCAPTAIGRTADACTGG